MTCLDNWADDPAAAAAALERLWAAGEVVGLAAPQERAELRQRLDRASEPLRRWGPAVVIGSGGSSGARRWCLQPVAHLRQSAAATGEWLQRQGIDPAGTVVVNPLPLHHVSGLLPLVRSRHWGVPLRWLAPAVMRQTETLLSLDPLPPERQALISLVPTQLHRLMADPAGLSWLRGFAVIWVGGASLAPPLAAAARQAGLRLSPCYGATETAAMVAAQPPQDFLAGETGYGAALADVELRLSSEGDGAIELRTSRLSPGWLGPGPRSPGAPVLQPFAGAEGWWRSGDAGRLDGTGLQVVGRLDGAILSGAETVFPERVEETLRQRARQAGLPLAELLLLPVADPLWGQRLVALYRTEDIAGRPEAGLAPSLTEIAQQLPAAQRPQRWIACPPLERNGLGKWERKRWQAWLASGRANSSMGSVSA
ncbi:MAG: AMP-binding protein [Cyanobacteria bacterium]|nr:AMP-binding protein [Cyanobacteria bacterium bin.51]